MVDYNRDEKMIRLNADHRTRGKPMSKKLLFIVNPRAGKTKSRAPLFDAAEVYSRAGYLISIQMTHAPGDATRLASELGASYDLIVCHGGDGTLNETISGVMTLPRERRPQVSYLPGGSTNDFAASLSISSDPAEAAQSAMRMRPLYLDVGVFNKRCFIYVASFGAFTRASYSVPQDVKNMFGHFAYILQGVQELDTLHPYPIGIQADGEDLSGDYLFGAVSNSTSIAGLMKLSPEHVAFDDGRFELLLVPVPKTAAAVQALTHALITRDYNASNGLTFRHVKKVHVEKSERIPWTLDGEYQPGAQEINISIEDNAVEMLL